MTRNRLRRDTAISQLIMLGPAVAVARSWLEAERFDAVPTFVNPGRAREPFADATDEGLRRGEGGRVEVKDELGAAVDGVALQADREGRGGVGEEVDGVGADPDVEDDHLRSGRSPQQCRLRLHGSVCCDV